MSAVVCTDLSGKEPHRQVDMGRVVTSGRIDGVMLSTLAWNAMEAVSIPAVGTLVIIFITPMIYPCMSDHHVSGMVSRWSSTIKSSCVRIVTSCGTS